MTSPPQITNQPASQSVYVGDAAMFSVAVFGAKPLFYQWQKNGTNLVDGGNLAGSTNATLSLTGVSLDDAGTYAVSVTNEFGSTNSTSAVLQVTSSPPVIAAPPANLTTNPCTTVGFSVGAVGNKPLAYQWQKNGTDLVDGANLTGSQTSTLTLNGVVEADSGTYAVTVTNALGSRTAAAVLAVVPQSAPCTTLAGLHWFTGTNDGGAPNALARGTNGFLYGTTRFGGAYDLGTVFSMATNGTFTTLASFAGTNGANPYAAPVQGADGFFYGTTFQGGSQNQGTVYALAADGTLVSLYSFTGASDGANPSASLVQGGDGSFYGTTTVGGAAGYGTVFRITPGGTFTNLHSFAGPEGRSPAGALALSCTGNLYGLTAAGGASDKGTVFMITPAGGLTTLYSFTGGLDGYTPAGALVQGPDGTFYGVTKYSTQSGSDLFGTVFSITPSGAFATLHKFVPPEGFYPSAGLVLSVDGNLYGTTFSDLNGRGTMFRVTPGGALATIATFDGCDDGAQPEAAVLEDTDGTLYGTTTTGGTGGQGTLVRLTSGCAPQVSMAPVTQGAVVGANVMLSVAVTGARPFAYQWQRNGTNLLAGGNVSGTTNRSLTLANVAVADSATYSVIVSNSLGVTSAAGTLTVVNPPVFLTAKRSSCTLTLTYSAVKGQTYRLQYEPSLTGTNWSYLGNPVRATAGTITATTTVCTNAQSFYRVVLFLPNQPQGCPSPPP